MSDKSGFNIEIEYLRAVAILMVVFVHMGAMIPGFQVGQWTGVDLFFCISGFVISRAFQPFFDQYITEGRWWQAARAFWVRRAFRLLPSAWFWLAVSVACSFIFTSQAWFSPPKQTLASAFYVLTFSTNLAYGSGLLEANRSFWSLTLEDQFYFLFPFYLLLVRGWLRWAIFLVLIYVQSIPNRTFTTQDYPSIWWTLRLDALMWGCLIYQFSTSVTYRMIEPTLFRFRIVAFAVSAIAIYCLVVIPKGTTLGGVFGYRNAESQVALFSALLVFLASYDKGYALPFGGLLKLLFKWIGARSYAIYLAHLPLFGLLMETWLKIRPATDSDPTWFYAIGIAVLVPIVAELNFRLIENPLRRRGAAIAKSIVVADRTAPSLRSHLMSRAGEG